MYRALVIVALSASHMLMQAEGGIALPLYRATSPADKAVCTLTPADATLGCAPDTKALDCTAWCTANIDAGAGVVRSNIFLPLTMTDSSYLMPDGTSSICVLKLNGCYGNDKMPTNLPVAELGEQLIVQHKGTRDSGWATKYPLAYRGAATSMTPLRADKFTTSSETIWVPLFSNLLHLEMAGSKLTDLASQNMFLMPKLKSLKITDLTVPFKPISNIPSENSDPLCNTAGPNGGSICDTPLLLHTDLEVLEIGGMPGASVPALVESPNVKWFPKPCNIKSLNLQNNAFPGIDDGAFANCKGSLTSLDLSRSMALTKFPLATLQDLCSPKLTSLKLVGVPYFNKRALPAKLPPCLSQGKIFVGDMSVKNSMILSSDGCFLAQDRSNNTFDATAFRGLYCRGGSKLGWFTPAAPLGSVKSEYCYCDGDAACVSAVTAATLDPVQEGGSRLCATCTVGVCVGIKGNIAGSNTCPETTPLPAAMAFKAVTHGLRAQAAVHHSAKNKHHGSK